MGKSVRMADIAQKLGISVVSVSKALSGKPGVSEEMRGKVIQLAKEMGYEGLRGRIVPGSTGNIGVLVANRFFDANTFYSNLYRSLVLSGSGRELACMLEIVSPDAERNGTLPVLITGQKADGIVLMGNFALKYWKAIVSTGIPCILLDFYVPGSDMDCVVSDNLNGGFTMTQHLISCGRQRIGFGGSILSTSCIMDRYLGYQKALRLAGIAPRDDWLLEDRDERGSFIPLVLPKEMPEAFVCNCDEVAYQLSETLRAAGLRVPEDVAICGYDDYRYALLAQPQLTTYRVNVELMADVAVTRLMQTIREPRHEGITFTVPGQIVVRGSSGMKQE